MQDAIPLVSDTRIVGVELEYEGVSVADSQDFISNYRTVMDNWELHDDQSLRPRHGGTEFVLSRPLKAAVAAKHTKELLQLLIEANAERTAHLRNTYQCSWRTGLHLHVDFRYRSSQAIRNTLLIGLFLDPLIFAWEGNGRQESKFCTPLENISATLSCSPNRNPNFCTRYASINALALDRHGSLEFRHPQSTLSWSLVKDYMNIVLGICAVGARGHYTSVELFNELAATPCLVTWVEKTLPYLAAVPLLRGASNSNTTFQPTSFQIEAGLKYLGVSF